MPPPEQPTVETVARRLLQTASAEVENTETAAVRDEPGAVHRHRTRVRRLRSVLDATRKIVDPAQTEPLRSSLKEWGRALGEVRDAQVRADTAEAALAEAGVDDADTRRRLVGDAHARYRVLHDHLVEVHDGPASSERRQQLREAGLSLTVTASDDAEKVFARLLRREARRVRRAAERGDRSEGSAHELRKAGRRLRYLAEALEEAAPGLLGSAPRKLAKAGRRIHDALGDRRDENFLRDRVQETRAQAFGAQEDTAPYDAILAAAPPHDDAEPKAVRKALRRVRAIAADLS
jgi:CHAD domain-containing protein